jgi:hypothetical protein
VEDADKKQVKELRILIGAMALTNKKLSFRRKIGGWGI